MQTIPKFAGTIMQWHFEKLAGFVTKSCQVLVSILATSCGMCFRSAVCCELIVAAHPWHTWLSEADWLPTHFEIPNQSSARQRQEGAGGTCPPHAEPYHAARLLVVASQLD